MSTIQEEVQAETTQLGISFQKCRCRLYMETFDWSEHKVKVTYGDAQTRLWEKNKQRTTAFLSTILMNRIQNR